MNRKIVQINKNMQRTFRIFSSLIIGLSLIFISSCENFLSGSDLRKELDTAVDYANAPYANIQILSDPDAKYTIVPSEGVYDKTYKKGDKIELDFTARSSFQFIKWVCEPEGAVDFGNAENSKTTATVKKDDVKIKIQPKTVKRATVSFSPSGNEVYPRNSPIIITFDTSMEFPEKLLDKIVISSGGESLKDHYEDPQIDSTKKVITYKPKRENLIPVENVKTININIPSDFYFISEDVTKVSLENDFSNAFKINSTTLDKANIEVKFDSTCGELTEGSAGEKTYYLDQQLDLVFHQKEEYKIDGWKIEIRKGNETSEKDYRLFLDPIKISDDKTHLSVKISCGIEENEKIIITPECSLRSTLKIQFKAENGSTNPSEPKQYYKNDTFNLSYSEDNGYAFTGWEVVDSKGNNVSDCVQIIGTGREVTVKVLKDDCSITIRAKYKRRPYIVSYSPTTATDDGTVMRDRTLVVIFDKRMDPSSIYFTKDELWEAGVYEKSGEDYLLNSEYTLLLSGKDGDANRKPYGYFKTNDTDGSSYVYKNIRITKLEDENVNLLKYYGEPVFDKNNPKTLRIYTQITNVDENGIPKPGEDKAPPQNIEILVVIGSGMVYDAGDGDFVATGTETPWAYITNRKTDAEPPVIDNGSISIVPCAPNANAYIADDDHDFKNYYYTDSDDASLTGAGKNERITEDVSRIKTFNANTGYIWVQAAVTDRGSGPASMIGYFTKRYDPYYSKAGDEGKTPGEADGVPKSFKFDFIDNGTTRHIDQKVNLAELGLDEGVYTLSFTSTDGNDHQSDSDCSYQFVYDVVPPAQIDNSTIRNIRESEAQETIKWSDPDTSDFGKTIIEIYDGETLKKSYDVSKGISSQLFDELEDRKGYKYKLRSVDYSGNESAVTEWEDTEGPADSSLITKSTIKNVRSSAEEETLSWTEPAAKENNYYIVEQYSPEEDFISRSELARSDTSKLFTGMSRGKYKYRFYSVDYANNISSNYTEWQDDVLPTATVTDIKNFRPSATYETISWTNPTGAAFDDVDYMQIDQYDGDSLKNSYTWTPSSPATQNQYTGLTGGTKYTYKFSCVDYAGNKIATTTEWQDNVGPGPVTDVYGGGKKNYKVHLYFDTPDTDEFSHVEIYKSTTKESITVKKLDCVASTLTVINQKAKHYEVQPGSNAGTNTEYIIKAFDYAGNTSDVTIYQGYAQDGMICYHNKVRNEVFVSNNFYGDKNPVGALYGINVTLGSRTNVNLVYDRNEYSRDDFIWGKYDAYPKGKIYGKKYDGYSDYVTYMNDSSSFANTVGYSNKSNNAYWASKDKNETKRTIWDFIYNDLNNQQKKNSGNDIFWYLPAIDHFEYIKGKKSYINNAFNTLTRNGVTATLNYKEGDSGIILGSSSVKEDGWGTYYSLKRNYLYSNDSFGTYNTEKDRSHETNWHLVAEINLD